MTYVKQSPQYAVLLSAASLKSFEFFYLMLRDFLVRFVDAIFMDCVMPVMDGPTAAREMRSIGYEGTIMGFTG